MLESRFDTISHAIIIKPILIIKTEEKKPLTCRAKFAACVGILTPMR